MKTIKESYDFCRIALIKILMQVIQPQNKQTSMYVSATCIKTYTLKKNCIARQCIPMSDRFIYTISQPSYTTLTCMLYHRSRVRERFLTYILHCSWSQSISHVLKTQTAGIDFCTQLKANKTTSTPLKYELVDRLRFTIL